MKKTIILIRGPVAVGKSTIASQLRDKIDNAVLFDVDYFIDMFGGNPRNREDKNLAYRNCIILAKQFVKHDCNIIIEELFYFQSDIDYFVKIFKKLGYKVKIFTLMASLKTLFKRNKERPKYKQLKEERIAYLYKNFEESKVHHLGVLIDSSKYSVSSIVNKIYKSSIV